MFLRDTWKAVAFIFHITLSVDFHLLFTTLMCCNQSEMAEIHFSAHKWFHVSVKHKRNILLTSSKDQLLGWIGVVSKDAM